MNRRFRESTLGPFRLVLTTEQQRVLQAVAGDALGELGPAGFAPVLASLERRGLLSRYTDSDHWYLTLAGSGAVQLLREAGLVPAARGAKAEAKAPPMPADR